MLLNLEFSFAGYKMDEKEIQSGLCADVTLWQVAQGSDHTTGEQNDYCVQGPMAKRNCPHALLCAVLPQSP